MTKIILFVAAALVAVAGVHAFSGLQLKESDLEALQTVQELLKDTRGWPNPSEILELIEDALRTIQEKIQQVSDELTDAIKAATKMIEDAAIALVDKWNDMINFWVDKANQLGVDVKVCTEGVKGDLAELGERFKEDGEQCLADPILAALREFDVLKDYLPQAIAIYEEAIKRTAECVSKKNPVLVGMCLAGYLPTLPVKAMSLATRAMVEAAVVLYKIAAIIPAVALCDAAATAGVASQATAIVDKAVNCIKDRIDQHH